MNGISVFSYKFGEFRKFPINARTMDEAILQMEPGAYSVFLIYPGKRTLHLDQHFQRIRDSANSQKALFSFLDKEMRVVLGLAINSANLEQMRVCMQVPFSDPDSLLLLVESFHPLTDEDFRRGIKAGLSNIQRNHPEVKDSRFVKVRQTLKQEQVGYDEILLCNAKGEILEGLSSNFYAIIGNRLYTANENVLKGISRNILLQIAPKIIEIVYEPIVVEDLPLIDEAFLTSSSRGVLPVIQVDKYKIGNGTTGSWTYALRNLYKVEVESELEVI
jgi:branched-chain amino acid aminotransferase